jgi:Tol biopolymer transport system component/DNA-binding winged helix-turn-helix (wHTH) protein
LSTQAGDPKYIETIPWRGYRFVADVREVWDENGGLIEPERAYVQGTSEDQGPPPYIQTAHTRGYGFIADVHEAGDEAEEVSAPERATTHSPSEQENADRLHRALKNEQALGDSPAVLEREAAPRAVSGSTSSTRIAESIARRMGFKLVRRPLPLVAMLSAVVLVAVIITAVVIRSRDRTRLSASDVSVILETMQVTTWPGLDFFPTLSPDGSSVAYSSDHDGRFEIYVKQFTPGAREIQITSDGQQNISPAWSPDGQYIAYYSMNRGGVWLVPSSGGVTRQLSEFGSLPAWSPDGTVVAFQSREISDGGVATLAMPPSTIWVVPARGGEPTRVTRSGVPAGGHGSPSWSPDGRRIAFVTSGGPSQIWSISVDGTDPKLIYRGGYNPLYSPDGEWIYFVGSSGASNFGVLKIRVLPQSGETSGKPIEIASTKQGSIRHFCISADGKKIAYTAQFDKSNIWSIAVSPASGEPQSAPAALTNETNRKGFPSFSSDGRRISFTDWPTGHPGAIWVMAADGAAARLITTDSATQQYSSWFPDGDRIAFLSYRRQRSEVWSAAIDTGKLLPVVDISPDGSFPRLSPEGRQIAFNSARTGTMNVWVAGVEGGELRQLTFDQELMGWPCWSPDGRFLATEMRRGDDTHIAIVPSSGGSPKQLTFAQGQSWPHSWSPDGDKIAFAGHRKGVWDVWWVSRTTGVEKQLTSNKKLNTYIRYPAWSPLGNQIVYEYGESTGNIWLLELKLNLDSGEFET